MKTETKTPTKETVVKTTTKADKPKLTAAYVKEMVKKGLSPLTGKPIRKYSRTGKRYVGKVAEEAKPETKTNVVKPVTEKIDTKAEDKPAIPVMKAKKAAPKAKKA